MLFSHVPLAEVLIRLWRVGIHEEPDAAWINLAVVAVVAELDGVGLTVSEVADIAVGKIAVVDVGGVELRDDVADTWLLVDVIACPDINCLYSLLPGRGQGSLPFLRCWGLRRRRR